MTTDPGVPIERIGRGAGLEHSRAEGVIAIGSGCASPARAMRQLA